MAGFYKSEAGRAIAHASYDRALKLWTVNYEEQWVETELGRTHVIVSGPEDEPPLVLLPGLFADATMWYPNAGAFAGDYRVYSVDLPVFGGKSEPGDHRIAGVADYAQWFRELIGRLGHGRVAVAGLSYGSWLCLALARELPDAITAVAMLDPSETFAKMDGGIAWRGLWTFALFPTRAKYTRFFTWLGGGYRDPAMDIWFEHMLDVIQYGAVGMFDVPQHRVYTAPELAMVTMPVLVVAGGKPILYKHPNHLAAAARRALPHAQVEIVPDTGHSLNAEKADVVNARVLQFLEAATAPA